MMTKLFVFFLLSSVLVYNAEADTKCNLRAIFKTPKQSDYDEFELMERSNFQSEEPKARSSEPNMPNTFSNARVLLRLGDYKNAVKRNNNNVNTKITLAGPNHNNYYQPPFLHPYYPPMVPPMGYPWNPFYSNPRIPPFYHPYYVVNTPRYIPQYPVLPPSVPLVDHVEINPKPSPKPKILINQPIVLDNSVIQQIPYASIQPKSSVSNGLNTMTVIPKILIDTVAKHVENLGSEKLSETPQEKSEISTTTTDSAPTESKAEESKPEIPDVQHLKIEEIQPNTQNLTEEEPGPIEISPDQIQNIPKEDANTENFQVVELAPAVPENVPQTDSLNIDNSITNSGIDQKEPDVMVEQEVMKEKPVVEPLQPETPPEDIPIHNMDHPRVLHPVKLSNKIENVEIVGAGNVNVSLAKNSPPKVEICSNTKDDELVNLLQKSLVPFINLKTKEEPKLLVSYPIINNFDKNIPGHPSAIIIESLRKEPTFCAACADNAQPRKKDVDIDNLNVFKISSMLPEVYPDHQASSSGYSVSSSVSSQIAPGFNGAPKAVISGYQVSSASGYYEDPTKKIVYKKPTEITVVPPQITEDVPGFVPTLIPQEQFYAPPQHIVMPNPYGSYLQPGRESLRSHSDLFDFMKYLLGDSNQHTLIHSRPSICPYCANMIRIPTVVRCPHCMNYHDVSKAYSSPEAHRSFCPNCMVHPSQHGWNTPRLPPRCPYCAKYKGELNQLEES